VTVWEADRAARNEFHPTQKPVELAQRAIRNSTRESEIVLDCFGGSGATMIAAEMEHRRAVLLELDPGYCDVIVARWQEFTGQKATRP
jgi:DNA modification methylase